MVGGLGIVLIFIMIIRHVGACVKEGYQNNYLKQHAVQNGYKTYNDANGNERITSNDHLAYRYLDTVEDNGVIVEDRVTGEKHYDSWERMFAECDKDTANGCTPSFYCPDKSVYDNPLGTKRSYIDRKTHQVLYLYKAPWKSDKDSHKQIKHECFYFADKNGNPIRKTQGQELIDKRAEENGYGYLNWSIEEIRELPKGYIDGVYEVMWQKTDNMTHRRLWKEAGLV